MNRLRLHVVEEVAVAAARAAGRAVADPLGLVLTLPVAPEAGNGRLYFDFSGRVVTEVMRERVPSVTAVDLTDIRRVRLVLDTPHGPAALGFARSRVSASNPHQLLVLMLFTALLASGIASIFLKNQLRPIRRLARAAEAFGRGRVVPYRPAGATEIRQAGAAFLDMRDRIERQIEQRTTMLAGVSHDLRTILTRFKLELAFLPEGEEPEERHHLPMTFTWSLPPLPHCPDLLLLATELAGIGGRTRGEESA